MRQEGRELERSRDARYQVQAAAIEDDIRRLAGISEFERENFDAMVRDVSKFLTWLRFDDDSLQKSFDFEEDYELARLDALVYAVIRADAVSDKANEKCFIDYDGDFKDSALKQDMAGLGITLLSSPESVVGFLKSKVRI